MNKKSVQHNKYIFCLFLLIWICETGIVFSQDESTEDCNERSNEEDISQLENIILNEKQDALKSILRNQLERVNNAEQNKKYEKETETEIDTKFYEKQDIEYDNEDNDEDNEEAEREYNPWQDNFQDQYENGTYVYGYALPNGVTQYERSFFSEKYKGRVVEGFYTQPRYFGKRILYELRCYRADYFSGYKPLRVQYLRSPPIVRRDEEPNVDCFEEE